MKLEFTEAKWQQDDSGFWISMKVCNPFAARQFLAQKKDKKYVAEIKEYHARRSLDSNAYCWVLIGKLAEVLRVSPEEIYRQAITSVGGNYEIFPVKNEAVVRWKEIWQSNGVGWICDDMGPSKLPGYTNVMCFYGSRVYDTAQMGRLIDIIVQECKLQGIETMTPDEIARMLEDENE